VKPVALHGNLRDFGVGEVFQLIGQQRKTGVLEVGHAGTRIQLHFDNGSVVTAAPVGASDHAALGDMLVRCGLLTPDRLMEAESEQASALQTLPRLLAERGLVPAEEITAIEDLLTRETIFELLLWEEGSFHFTAQPVAHERASETLLGAEQILMDGLRMVDEWRTFRHHVPSTELVFRRSAGFEALQRRGGDHPVPAGLERVFLLVDGRQTARRVIDLSRLGTFEATRMLAELRQAGAIAPISQEGQKIRRRTAAASAEHPLKRFAGALVPIGVLVLVLALQRFPDVGGRSGVRIDRDPLADARAALEARGLRHLVRAHRFAAGAAPQRLEDLADTGFERAGALTPEKRRLYYYARRGADVEVLAPER
jgi:hypothetical protein